MSATDAAPVGAATLTAASNSGSSDGAATAAPSSTSAAASSSSSSSPAYPSGHPWLVLRGLQSAALPLLTQGRWSAAEKVLDQMVALLEAERVKKTSSYLPPLGAPVLTLGHQSVSQALFFVHHDLSLALAKQGRWNDALKHVTVCLGFFEEDDYEDEEDEATAPAASKEDDDAEAPPKDDARSATTGSSSRALLLRKVLLQDPHSPTAWLGDVLPSSTALGVVNFPLAPSVVTVTGKLPPAPVMAPRNAGTSLYLALLCRRFLAACLVRPATKKPAVAAAAGAAKPSTATAADQPLQGPQQLELAMQCGAELLALVAETDSAREVLLDDLERQVLSPMDNGAGGGVAQPTNLYGHILSFWHEHLLPAVALLRAQEVEGEKKKGNDSYALAVAAPIAGEGKAESHARRALEHYDFALNRCGELLHVLQESDTCPSLPWFELAASYAPARLAAQTKAAAAARAAEAKAAGKSVLTANAAADQDEPGFNVLLARRPPQPFSLLHLSWTMSQLRANAAAAALKCSPKDFAPQAATSSTGTKGKQPPQPQLSGPRNAVVAKSHAEECLQILEKLSRSMRGARQAAKDAEASSQAKVIDLDTEPEPSIFAHNAPLLAALPEQKALDSLLSKAYFRHGQACYALDQTSMDTLAEQSWALSLRLQGDAKARAQIEACRQARKNLFLKGMTKDKAAEHAAVKAEETKQTQKAAQVAARKFAETFNSEKPAPAPALAAAAAAQEDDTPALESKPVPAPASATPANQPD